MHNKLYWLQTDVHLHIEAGGNEPPVRERNSLNSDRSTTYIYLSHEMREGLELQ